ncbi:MAG TPA: lipopolysaccharide heptosyltransferase II [Gemmatimonadales bacterium]|nr:lipopolysaccharide heptosyltransferase II [Gemmatimonadales bacterium]
MQDVPISLNVLAVRFSSIGDVLLTTPLLRAIRRRYPDARITVLTKPAYVSLLSHNPHVDRVLDAPPDRPLRLLARELRAGRYTHLLDLHDSLRSRLLRAMVPGPWSTYPKHRLARAALIYSKRDYYRHRRPLAERYFDAARALQLTPDGECPDFFVSPEAERETEAWLTGTDLEQRPIIALAPGAAHSTKRWPVEHWRLLAGRLLEQGFRLIVVGGTEDARLGDALVSIMDGRIANAAGRFGLQGTGALLRRAAVLVSGDTGVMHMATAVKTPVVALFGPTVRPFGFFPYSQRAEVIELELPCRPCSSKGGPRCPLGHHRCMLDIAPDLVHAAVNRSLG